MARGRRDLTWVDETKPFQGEALLRGKKKEKNGTLGREGGQTSGQKLHKCKGRTMCKKKSGGDEENSSEGGGERSRLPVGNFGKSLRIKQTLNKQNMKKGGEKRKDCKR